MIASKYLRFITCEKADELGSLVKERYPSTKLLGRNHLEFLHLGITMRFLNNWTSIGFHWAPP